MSLDVSGKVHVLIVHYNTPELTSRLVRALPDKTGCGRTISIHVLDNSSADNNYEKLRDGIAAVQNAALTRSAHNLGFGLGINLLAEKAEADDSDLLWILNPDTAPDADCVDLLEANLDAGPFDIVAPLIYSGSGTGAWIWFCGASMELRSLRVRHNLFGASLASAPQASFETEFITGAAPMMRASTFRTIGGFPSNYFLYWEDAHLCWAARKHAFRLGVVPRARLWHEVGASSGSRQSANWYYWYTRNRFTLGRDVGIPISRLLIGRGAAETLRPIAKAVIKERQDRLAKLRGALRGTASGMRGGRPPQPS